MSVIGGLESFVIKDIPLETLAFSGILNVSVEININWRLIAVVAKWILCFPSDHSYHIHEVSAYRIVSRTVDPNYLSVSTYWIG